MSVRGLALPFASRKKAEGMRIRRWLLVILTPPTLAVFAGPASAQQKAEDKSRPAGTERKSVDKASPILMTGKLTRVDESA
jgi:hypothetical protein